MWIGIWLAVFGLLLGVVLGLNIPVILPQVYAKYLGLAILAALDSVVGGIRAMLDDKFDNTIFLSGFFVNALLAAGLAFVGEKLAVDLYLAAVVAFGVRLFQNLATIRRYVFGKK